jgi:hypothetical protein
MDRVDGKASDSNQGAKKDIRPGFLPKGRLRRVGRTVEWPVEGGGFKGFY